ncbi:hypothetical protein CFRA_05155 [Corynebacterium frankenforstense DSM 45800]|uniref:Or membrane protein n=1 Tax=Corynebacterium frankenforstense DSM 45800 TaxID=1437875 RepID=A0A1L7CSB5_9CORY|nr:hypothetical protein [Corynebacterium frankenforstense]APT88733.1 hypothetical protein CFRA_05155 [Corynebacterium frankenforstense DSM 45800]
MKLFTRKGIVTLGATVAIATTGIVAPANAEEGTPTETTAASSTVETTPEKPAANPTDKNENPAPTSDPEAPVNENVSSSEYDCDDENAPSNVKNSLKCQWEKGEFDERLGIITGFATLITTVIGVASAVFSLVKKVAPDLF